MLIFCWIVAGLWALVCLAVAQQPGGGAGAYLLVVAVGLAPCALLVLIGLSKAKGRESLRDAAMALSPIAPGTRSFQHEEEGTGMALNCPIQKLILWGQGAAKCYDYDEVRSWEFIHEEAAWANAGTVAQGLHNKRLATRNTGFYIEVRDIDMPKWRVVMTDHATQLRWMEIFRQEVKERVSA